MLQEAAITTRSERSSIALLFAQGRVLCKTRVLSRLDAQRLRPFRVPDYIFRLIVLRVLRVGSRKVLPRIQHTDPVLFRLDLARALQRAMDADVDLAAAFIVGRDD